MSEVKTELVRKNSDRSLTAEAAGITSNVDAVLQIQTEGASNVHTSNVYFRAEDFYFKCSFCDMYCLGSIRMCLHVNMNHMEAYQSNEDSFICQKCRKKFTILTTYVSHKCFKEMNKYSKKVSVCFYCEEHFPKRSDLVSHIERDHGEKEIISSDEVRTINETLALKSKSYDHEAHISSTRHHTRRIF